MIGRAVSGHNLVSLHWIRTIADKSLRASLLVMSTGGGSLLMRSRSLRSWS
jgi:hypothetical protein